MRDFFQQRLWRPEGSDTIYLKRWKEKLTTKNILSSKALFRFDEEIKCFTDKKQLREFNTKPVLLDAAGTSLDEKERPQLGTREL